MQHFPSRNCSGGNLQARRENGREGSLEIYGTKAVNCSGGNLQARRGNGREGSLEISGTKAVVRLSVEVLKLKIGTSTDRQTSELIKRIWLGKDCCLAGKGSPDGRTQFFYIVRHGLVLAPNNLIMWTPQDLHMRLEGAPFTFLLYTFAQKI